MPVDNSGSNEQNTTLRLMELKALARVLELSLRMSGYPQFGPIWLDWRVLQCWLLVRSVV